MWKEYFVVLIAAVFPGREYAIKQVVNDIIAKQSEFIDKIIISGCKTYTRSNKHLRYVPITVCFVNLRAASSHQIGTTKKGK